MMVYRTRGAAAAILQRVYRRHLANISIFRYLRAIYVRVVPDANLYKIVTQFPNALTQPIRAGEIRLVPRPRFFSPPTCKPEMEAVVQVHNPRLTITFIPNASVIASSNVVLHGRRALLPEHYDAERDVTTLEMHTLAEVNISTNKIGITTLIDHNKSPSVPAGINLVGQCAGNYAHFLTEVIPRLVLADVSEVSRNIPVLVDGNLGSAFYKILEFFNVNDRPVVKVTAFSKMNVEELVHISDPAYAPVDSRQFFYTGILPDPSNKFFSFSTFAIGLMRQVAHQRLNQGFSKKKRQRVFLRRKSATSAHLRLLANDEQIERVAVEMGLLVVDPMEMTFAQQVELFGSCELVVSPIGAALANTLFCPSGSKVIVLSPYYDRANYHYFFSLVTSAGHDLTYVLGTHSDSVEKSVSVMNQNYEISTDLFRQALQFNLAELEAGKNALSRSLDTVVD